MKSLFYFYDNEYCRFHPIKYDQKDRIIHTLSLYSILGIVMTGIILSIMSATINTPAEIALNIENDRLKDQLSEYQDMISNLDNKLQELVEKDIKIYRTLMGLDTTNVTHKHIGVGGSVPSYDRFNYNEETIQKLNEIDLDLVTIEQQLKLQEQSSNLIQKAVVDHNENLRYIPIIRPTEGVLLSGFGIRIHPILKYKKFHYGLDFRADIGQPIYAPADGIVSVATKRGSYGNLLILKHGKTYETRYAHLSGFPENIQPGVVVKRGQLVGYCGNSGLSEGPHLHYEILKNKEYVDPLEYIFANISLEEYQYYQTIVKTHPRSLD